MALQRQITLRNVKGSALTYEEMDKNLSSFFYSASLDGADLLLHYTGSSVLNAPYTPSSVIVPLNPLLATITQLTVAGNQVGDIQYRINPSTLGADSSFKWDTVNYRLGVGVGSPVATLDVMQLDAGKPSRVRITTQDITTGNRTAALELYQGNTFIGSFGKTNASRPDIYTIVGDSTRSAYTTIGTTNVLRVIRTGVGILTGTGSPNKALTVVGEIGVGTNTGRNQGILGNIITAGVPLGKVSQASLPNSTGLLGLLIESPYASGTSGTGGHVVIGINTTSTVQNTAFSVVAGGAGFYNLPILTATATGEIGINNANPVEALDIVGNTTMTGNLTIGTVTDSLGANSQILTRDSTTGLVQYTTNIMPKGGIIMWAGSPTALPTGWTLCDGRAAVNLVTIPDLRERFIVGAGGDNTEIATYDFNRFYVRATLSFTTSTTSTGVITSLTSRNIDTYLTKVNESSMVASNIYYNTNTDAPNTFPTERRRYALYSFAPPTGADKTNSYFVVYNKDINKYRMYCGVVPSNNTDISNRFNYPYLDFPADAMAELRSSRMPSGTKLVIYRPNVSQLEWEETTTGYAVNDIGGFNHVRQQISEMPSHTHEYQDAYYAENQGQGQGLYGQNSDSDNDNDPIYRYENPTGGSAIPPPEGRRPTTYFAGGNFPHENRPPYYALAFIIYTGV